MAFGDIAGIGQLKEALTTTNKNLELVLAELQETNRLRLELVAVELQRTNKLLESLIASGAVIAPGNPAALQA